MFVNTGELDFKLGHFYFFILPLCEAVCYECSDKSIKKAGSTMCSLWNVLELYPLARWAHHKMHKHLFS